MSSVKLRGHVIYGLGSSILAVLLAIAVPFNVYIVPGTHTSIILLFFALAMPFAFCVKKPLRDTLCVAFWAMLFVLLNVVTMFLHLNESWLDLSTQINTSLFSMLAFVVFIYYYGSRFSLKVFIQTVFLVAIGASLIVFYQRISYMMFGDYYKNFFIPGLPIPKEYLFNKEGVYINRPSAFFSEPSHYALFVLPVLSLCLQRKKWFVFLVLVLGILCSGSTNGFVGLIVILFMFFFIERKSIKSLILLSAVAIVLFSAFQMGVMSDGMSKVENTDVKNYSRLLGSLPVFRPFTWKEWLCGFGQGNKLSYMAFYHIFVGIDTYDPYINTYLGMLANYGILGFAAFVLFMVKLWRKYTKGTTKTYLVLFLTLSLSTSMLFNWTMLYYMIFIVCSGELARIDNESKKETLFLR